MAIRFLSSENIAGDIDINLSKNGITYLAVTNTNTGVSANARVQVVGESSQIDIIATSAGYTGVSGWADSGVISTDSGASGGLILNSVAGIVKLQTSQTTALTIDSSQNANFAGDVKIATGKELIIGSQTAAESPLGITIRDNQGDVPVGIVIHNENAGASADAQIAFETQAAMDFSIGIDRSDSHKFVMSRAGALGTNNVFTIDGTAATFLGNVLLPTASSYIKLGGYSYIGEDLTDQDSLTIASDSTESIYFAHFNQGDSTYTTTAQIDSSGNFIVGNTAYGSSLGQVRIINDAATAPASLSLFGYNNIPDQGIYASIDMAMQLSGTGGQVAASIKGVADGVGENTSDIAFHTASAGTLSEKMRIGYNGQIGIGASTNLDGRLDLRMVFAGQNWVPDGTSAKWSEVWCNSGTPGTYFNNTMLHIDTNRGGGATGGVVGIAFSPGWQGHQNWGIYSYNTTGSSYTSGNLSFVSQINTGDRLERMRLNGVNGCVGIGIDTAPASNVKLRVVGDTNSEWVTEIKSTNTAGNTYGLVVNTLAGAGTYNLGCYTHTGNGFFVQNDGKVGIGTGTATEGRLHVTQSYSASLRTGYFQSSAYSAPHIVYDSLAINQQDVPCLVLVETPATAVSSHQKLTLAVGDNNAVIRTANTSGGMYFNVQASLTAPGYQTTSGLTGIHIKNDGDVIMSAGRVAIGSTVASYGVLEIETESALAYSASSFTNGANIRLKSGGTPTTGTTTGVSFGAGGAAELYFGLEQQSSTLAHAIWQMYSGSAYQTNMRLSHDGNLTVKGDIVAYGSPSDKRLKENIKPVESALDKVSKLQGVTFDWKKSDSELNIKEDIGFIAQDVQKVIPELVRENEDGMLSMRHQGIAPILLEAIKELKAEIEELKKHKCNCKE